MKARVIDMLITWVSSYKKFKSDTHVIARRVCVKEARGEPITIENVVVDTIIIIIVHLYSTHIHYLP